MKWLTQLVFLLLCFVAIPSYAIETITYYHTDSLGSPVAGTDTSGALLWKEDYKPYGERIRKQVESDKNTRWYTGHPEDKETGLTYAGARFYDSVTGRFLVIDPVGFKENNLQMFNRYAYANNNPYKYVDPDGSTAVLPIGGTGGFFLIGGAVIFSGTTPEERSLLASSLSGLAADYARARYGVVLNKTGSEDDLLKDTAPKPRSKKKKNEKTEERDYVGGGGLDEANEKFDNTLKPKNVKDHGDGVRSGELDNGTRVTVRPKNSPSIDINRPGKKPIKVRF